jgi:predicted MFS family arabinose efflux permease
MLMTAVPGITLVTFFFLIRGSIYGFSLPLGNQISMELVVSKERGTTAGATHAAFDLGGGVGALTAGGMVAASGFAAAFAVASALFLVPALLYYTYFGYLDRGTVTVAEPQPVLTR